MKSKISRICLLLVICLFSFTIFSSSIFAVSEARDIDFSTTLSFVTNNDWEGHFLQTLPQIVADTDLARTHQVSGAGLIQVGKKLRTYDVRNSQQASQATGETIIYNFSLLTDPAVVQAVHQQVQKGKTVLFYGEDIDLQFFTGIFGLERCLAPVSQNPDKSAAADTQAAVDAAMVVVGLEAADWGLTLITVTDEAYDFLRAIDASIANAIHARKIKVTEPYKNLNNNRSPAESGTLGNLRKILAAKPVAAGDIDDYPILNGQRNTAYTYFNTYYLITDAYLHRIADSDPDYDYLILETISELQDLASGAGTKFNTKLQGYYVTDEARSGGPATQGSSSTVSVSFYPPSVGYSYDPECTVSVSSSLSLSNRSYTSTFTAQSGYPYCAFYNNTIHMTDLSFRTYAATEYLTFAQVSISQKIYIFSSWHYFCNPWNYYYDY